MKILIVENGDHYKVLQNVYYLISGNCEKAQLTFYIRHPFFRISEIRAKKLLFPELTGLKYIINPLLRQELFFVSLIFFGWRYRLINISTGVEDSSYRAIINAISFLLISFLYGKKIVLTIKNLRRYLKNSPGIIPWILNKSLKYIRGFTFETKTMRDVFHEETKIEMSKLSVSYDRYTDLNKTPIITHNRIKTTDNQDIYIIGLTGTIDVSRRNYFDLLDIIQQIPAKKREKFLFVTLGYVVQGGNNVVIKELEKLTKVNFTNEWLSAEEFEIRGSQCDLLISPLQKHFEYGTYKGSGSFGDAIFLRKKIILPSYVDPKKEFIDISIYYDNKDGLLRIFENIEDYINMEIPDKFYANYTTKAVFNNIKKELQLESLCI